MDQPKVDRMLRLMQMLSSNVNYSVDDLMKELDISRRTVYRYIETFKSAGFAVQNTHGNVWRLANLKNKYGDLSKVVYFSEEEAYILNCLLESLDNTNALKQALRRKLVAVYDFEAVGEYEAKESVSLQMDDFRIHGETPVHVRLRMDMVARNLLLEEYPLAEKNLTADGDYWIYEADCNGMKGVGRFVLSIPDRIEILEGEEVKAYLKEKAGYILSSEAL